VKKHFNRYIGVEVWSEQAIISYTEHWSTDAENSALSSQE